MPLSREVEYWDEIASQCVCDRGLLRDNVWKRAPQIRMLLDYDFDKQKVLEIGVGNAMIAGALQVIFQGNMDYLGTDLSDIFIRHAKAHFNLHVVQADVREIPGSGYTRIIAFDSLEHVKPEHRPEGYTRLGMVAAEGALLFIHYSHSFSAHDKEFDHPFGLVDIVALEQAGFTLRHFKRYACLNKKRGENMDYVFLVMQK